MVAIAIEVKLPIRVADRVLPSGASLSFLPYRLGPFTGREAHAPDVKGFPGEVHRLYQDQGNTVELLAYPTELNEHAPERCLRYLGWSMIARQRRSLQANPAIELQTILAVSDNPSEPPLACGYYWRRNNAATDGLVVSWLQQRWATVTRFRQQAELVTICTHLSDVRRSQPAFQRVYAFANDLEPYFRLGPPRVLESRTRRLPGR